MEKTISYVEKTKNAVRPMVRKIGKMPFWLMALLCFGMRIFVKQPLGALLVIVVGSIWAFKNISVIRVFLVSFRNRMIVNLRGYEKESLWFENGGRERIKALIVQLSAKGICFCNLSEAIGDLPPVSHWYAISSGLEVIGVTAQISGDTFYISWKVQTQQGENTEG